MYFSFHGITEYQDSGMWRCILLQLLRKKGIVVWPLDVRWRHILVTSLAIAELSKLAKPYLNKRTVGMGIMQCTLRGYVEVEIGSVWFSAIVTRYLISRLNGQLDQSISGIGVCTYWCGLLCNIWLEVFHFFFVIAETISFDKQSWSGIEMNDLAFEWVCSLGVNEMKRGVLCVLWLPVFNSGRCSCNWKEVAYLTFESWHCN